MQLTPTIAIHTAAALAAVAIGPFALWARLGKTMRPALHRACGYAWVTLMLATAVSALFIRDYGLPNIAGYTPIHLFVPYTVFGIASAFWFVRQRNIAKHRQIMLQVYIGACGIAGLFTLLPGRMLGQLVWRQWLGWL